MGLYGLLQTSHRPHRALAGLYRPQLASWATWALNGPLMCMCGPLLAYSDTPAFNGPLTGQCRPQLASHGPVRASTGLSWATHGLHRATTGLYAHQRPLIGLYAPQGPQLASHWPLIDIYGPLLASTGLSWATTCHMGLSWATWASPPFPPTWLRESAVCPTPSPPPLSPGIPIPGLV